MLHASWGLAVLVFRACSEVCFRILRGHGSCPRVAARVLQRPRGGDPGPAQGRDHQRRREHFLGRDGGDAAPSPRRAGGRDRRPAGREVGRDAARLRGAPRRRQRHRGGHHRVHARAPRPISRPRAASPSSASYRKPRPARSRSSSCARVQPTSPISSTWRPSPCCFVCSSGGYDTRNCRQTGTSETDITTRTPRPGSCTRTVRSSRTTGPPRTALLPGCPRRARGWRRPCR